MLRIKELREQERLNQMGLALRLNVSQSTISAYETGERTPDLHALIAIAEHFDVSLDYLTGLSDEKRVMRRGDLTPEEIAHLHAYRQLNDVEKGKVQAYMDGLRGK